MHIHIGHHFFGSGNLGDDFMMAGFLDGMGKANVHYTCCVPYELEPLKKRFPEIEWLPYNISSRSNAITSCDAWLGLGGSPFQSSVSDWFTTHLCDEASACKKAEKPMYFMGIGGQDEDAYTNPSLKAVIEQAKAIWTRDLVTFKLLKNHLNSTTALFESSDLSHIYFNSVVMPKPISGRLAACLNFDYLPWNNLQPTITTLSKEPSFKEKLWIVQESRPLPEAEHSLYSQLIPEEQKQWKVTPLSRPEISIQGLMSSWPSSEWTLSSRFHTAIASAWAGSKTVVIDTNLKLRGIAQELNLPCLSLNCEPADILTTLKAAKTSSSEQLQFHAKRAEAAVHTFVKLIGV